MTFIPKFPSVSTSSVLCLLFLQVADFQVFSDIFIMPLIIFFLIAWLLQPLKAYPELSVSLQVCSDQNRLCICVCVHVCLCVLCLYAYVCVSSCFYQAVKEIMMFIYLFNKYYLRSLYMPGAAPDSQTSKTSTIAKFLVLRRLIF